MEDQKEFEAKLSFVYDNRLFCFMVASLGIGIGDHEIYKAIKLNKNIVEVEILDGKLWVTDVSGDSVSFTGSPDELNSLKDQILANREIA